MEQLTPTKLLSLLQPDLLQQKGVGEERTVPRGLGITDAQLYPKKGKYHFFNFLTADPAELSEPQGCRDVLFLCRMLSLWAGGGCSIIPSS